MRFELYVAARYLKAKRRQAVVGVVTAISIAGVAAGVAALIIALAITNGMRRDLQDRLVDSSAHVQLMRVKKTASATGSRSSNGSPSCPTSSPPRPNSTSRSWSLAAPAPATRSSKASSPPGTKTSASVLSNAPATAVRALDPAPPPADPANCRTAASHPRQRSGGLDRRQRWRLHPASQPAR